MKTLLSVKKMAEAAGTPSGSKLAGALRLSGVAAVALLMCASSSCKKEDGAEPSPVYGVRTFHASSEVQSGDGKTMLEGKIVNWEINDEAAVWGNGNSGSTPLRYLARDGGSPNTDYYLDGENGASGDRFCAIYPYSAAKGSVCTFPGSGDPTWGISLPKYQIGSMVGTFARNANVMAAKIEGSDNLAFQFKNLCGVLRLKLRGSSDIKVKSIQVVSLKDENLWGNGTVTFKAGTKTDRHSLDNLDGDNGVWLVYPNGVSLEYDDDGAEFDVVLPGGTLSSGFGLDVYCEWGDGKKGVFTTGTANAGAKIVQNQITSMAPILVEEGNIKEGVLPGRFSVSATDKVRFSKGNLWCDRITAEGATWSFESNQWESQPTSDGNWNTSHVSHFSWSANVEEAFTTSTSLSGSASDVLFTNAPGSQTEPNPSFTVNGRTGVWRVLSGASTGEWNYLVVTRKTSESKVDHSYAIVRHSSTAGMLLFPDGFDGWDVVPDGVTYDNKVTYVSVDVLVDVSGVFSELEAMGVVFLPCAGDRNGAAAINNVGMYGCYWSFLPDDDNINKAYHLSFASGQVYPVNLNFRYYGRAVRLVCS